MIKIAIIENDEDVSDGYRTLLEAAWGEQVSVDQLFNIHQAKEGLARSNYDLISLDLALGDDAPKDASDLEGLTLLADMDRNMRSTVLVVSGAVTVAADYLKLMRVMDTLPKPHTLQDYLKAVRLGLEVQGKFATTKGELSKTALVVGKLKIDPLNGPPTWSGTRLDGCTLTHQRILYKLVSAAPAAVPIKNLLVALPAIRPTRESLNTHISDMRKIFRAAGEQNDLIRADAGSYRWVVN